MVQSEQMPTTGEFEEMQVHIHVHACTYMYFVYSNPVHIKYMLNYIGTPYWFFFQADLLFKKEEKEKSEATAKTLELGTSCSLHCSATKGAIH